MTIFFLIPSILGSTGPSQFGWMASREGLCEEGLLLETGEAMTRQLFEEQRLGRGASHFKTISPMAK